MAAQGGSVGPTHRKIALHENERGCRGNLKETQVSQTVMDRRHKPRLNEVLAYFGEELFLPLRLTLLLKLN